MLTTCPECHTTFRIGHEQLEARRGMVRCGTCSAVFNAYDTLLPDLDTPPGEEVQPGQQFLPQEEAIATDSQAIAEADEASFDQALEPEAEVPGIPRFWAGESALQAEPAAEVDWSAEPEVAEAIDQVRKREEAEEEAEASPKARVSMAVGRESADAILLSDLPTRQDGASPGASWKLLLQSLAVLLLLAAFLGQLTYFLRGEIASRQPEWRPWLEAACEHLGCRIPLAQDLDLLRVEWSSLETDPEQPSQARLRVTLSNRSQAEQAWPYLILKLTDAKNAPLAQRAFAPGDYLPKDRKHAYGVRPMSEQEFRLDLDLVALEAAGYEVKLRYP
ncbi:MAG: DUF3426 domain-containing protein [Chromatiaceae bacterium]|nr:DUF3426 domain-containing protein [Candidatus Thioaporhodococcus sediminis]